MSEEAVNILLVDDRPENLLALEALLGNEGPTLVRATSGEEALRRVLETDFAVILLDVQMPGLSGFEVAQLVRARDRSRHTPIIFLTAADSDDFPVERAYALGAVDYLVKPLSPIILRTKVAVFVELFCRTREARNAERIQAETAAREERQLWRTILSSIGDAVIVTDPRGRVTFLNPVAEALTGWPAGEALGRPLVEVFRIVHEGTGEPVENPALRALQTGAYVGITRPLILISRDGERKPIDDSAAPIRDESGIVSGAVLVFRDITERNRADAEQARLAAIVESSDDAIVGKTLDGIIRSWNAGAERVFGYPAAEAIGKPITLIVPRERLDEERGILDRIRRGERVDHFETTRVAKDGRRVDISLTVSPIRDRDGRVIGASKVARDITDRKKAEELLREKDERLKLLVDRARDYAVVLTDRTGVVVEWAGGAESITGFASASMIGRSAEAIFTPEDRAVGEPAREMETAIREGRSEDKRWHQKADGTEFFADGVMVPLRGDDGELHGFGKVFRDVTDRKRWEEAVGFLADAGASLAELVDYESTLRRIANLAVRGFADWCVFDVCDEKGIRRRVSVRTREPVEPSIKLPTESDLPLVDEVISHVMSTGDARIVSDLDSASASPESERMRPLRALGIRSYLCVPLVSRGRPIGGMVFLSASSRRLFGPSELRVAQNLAERVTIALENIQLYRALQEQDRRKDEFLATLAHELRNPLAPVRNGVRILQLAKPMNDGATKTLAMMDRQVEQMTRLIDDLMDVSRVSSGKVVLRKECIALRTALDVALETTRPLIAEAGHEIGLRLPSEALMLDADPTRLVQVLSNLLNNAAKYTPPGGRIEISAGKESEYAVLRIADTGIGIPADMLPQIFELFAQVGSSLERSEGGLGIGLTLARRLVEMHGGSVAAESPGPGKGSTFVVRLPLAVRTDSSPTRSVVDQNKGVGSGSLGILVVDDNQDSADTLSMLLQMNGHEVRTANDGPEALRVLGGFRPDLVLLDLGLPGMSGYEVARRIRENAELNNVALAALTGWGNEEDRRRTSEAGFDYHLVKPADPDQLDAMITELRR